VSDLAYLLLFVLGVLVYIIARCEEGTW
jgi:hypothetical protein